jgi:ABC-2 type transport system ATP-binding protein
MSESLLSLEVTQLTKHFGRNTAVDSLNMAIKPGELVGLVGPNGAGKSTTTKMLTGLLRPDSGSILIDGRAIDDAPLMARKLTGYVPQKTQLYPFLTGRETLEFCAQVHELDQGQAAERMKDLLHRFNLTEAQHRMTREYSEGMARKLAIAVALMGSPKLLILDESLSGLDPPAAAEVKSIMRERAAEGTAVLWVSHMLDAVERICTKIIILSQGKLVRTLDQTELNALATQGQTLEDIFLASTGPGSP